MPFQRLAARHFGISKPALLLLLLLLILLPIAAAQRTPITDGDIKLAVLDWTMSPTTAATTYGNIGDWNVASVTNMQSLFYAMPTFDADIGRWNVARVVTWTGCSLRTGPGHVRRPGGGVV